MKILTFILGGVEKVALRMASYWSSAGHYAPVLVSRPYGAMKAQLPKGAHIIVPERPIINPLPFETLWMMCILPKYLRLERPDILFCPGNSYTIVAVLMKLILGRDCPFIVAKISDDLHRRDFPRILHLVRLRGRTGGVAGGIGIRDADHCHGLQCQHERPPRWRKFGTANPNWRFIGTGCCHSRGISHSSTCSRKAGNGPSQEQRTKASVRASNVGTMDDHFSRLFYIYARQAMRCAA